MKPDERTVPGSGERGAAHAPPRTLAETGLAFFCAATLVFLVYRDLALPHVGRVEVWLGLELHGAWARWSAPLHWAIYAGGALAFWRAWRPIWSLAIGYSVYIALSHLIWNLTSTAGGGLGAGIVQMGLFLVPTGVLLGLRPPTGARDGTPGRDRTHPSHPS